jgi:uncharacterized protein
MTAYLLDVNVLIALAWPEHRLHSVARAWFAQNSAKGWATCPFVEVAFVRIVSNPAFSARSISVAEAVDGLRMSLRDSAHQFWPDSISFLEAAQLIEDRLTGHQQITDAYLVALAMKNRGKLATLDRGILKFAPARAVEVIRPN